MTKQQLFYENATPVSSQRHKNWSVDTTVSYEFAKATNSVPLMTVEIPHAAYEYTIVFAGGDDVPVPVVLLGLERDQNLYVNGNGRWATRYIPAFVRRYPFVFARGQDQDTLTLCIDESWTGCNQEGRGQRLFDDDGKGTPFMEKMFGFVKQYQVEMQRTTDYCAKLKELELLEPTKVQFTLPGGAERSLTGFQAVSRDKLKALPADTLKELVQNNQMELTYAHLQSMNNFQQLAERLAKERRETSAAAG